MNSNFLKYNPNITGRRINLKNFIKKNFNNIFVTLIRTRNANEGKRGREKLLLIIMKKKKKKGRKRATK